MKHLFAYGTLMCRDIMAEVSGQDAVRESTPIPAVLRDYRRLCVRGEHYPALIRQAGHQVDGVVYRDISRSAWQRLDRFEGEMYSRLDEQVEMAAGETIIASVYVLHADYRDCLDDREWDFDAFLRHGKKYFRNSYLGYDEI